MAACQRPGLLASTSLCCRGADITKAFDAWAALGRKDRRYEMFRKRYDNLVKEKKTLMQSRATLAAATGPRLGPVGFNPGPKTLSADLVRMSAAPFSPFVVTLSWA